MAEFKYIPQWEGPLSGRSFEKQTEDAINAVNRRIDEYVSPISPYDGRPNGPNGNGNPGTSPLYARGDHQHPEQDSVPGAAGTAGRLTQARRIGLDGDASGGVYFDGSADVAIDVSIADAIPSGAVISGTEYPQGRHGFMTGDDKAKLDTFNAYPRFETVSVGTADEPVSGMASSGALPDDGPAELKMLAGHGLQAALVVTSGAAEFSLGVDTDQLAGHGLLVSSGALAIAPAGLATNESPGLMSPGDKDMLGQAIVEISANENIVNYRRAGGDTGFFEITGAGGGEDGGEIDLSGLATKEEALASIDGELSYSTEAPVRYGNGQQQAAVAASVTVQGSGVIVTSISGWTSIRNMEAGAPGTDAEGEAPGTPTQVVVTCGGSAGTEIPAGSRIKDGDDNVYESVNGAKIPSSIVLRFSCSGPLNAEIPAGKTIQTSGGVTYVTADAVTLAEETEEGSGIGAGAIPVTCTGPGGTAIASGTVLQDGDGITYTSLEAGLIPASSTVDVLFACTEVGPVECPAGALRNGTWTETQSTSSGMTLRAGSPVEIAFSTASLPHASDAADESVLTLSVSAVPGNADAAISSAVLSGTVLSISAGSLSADGMEASGTAALNVAWQEPDAEHEDGATAEFGTFTVLWRRNTLYYYSVTVTWNAPEGMATRAPDAVLVLAEKNAAGSVSYHEVDCASLATRIEANAAATAGAQNDIASMQESLGQLAQEAVTSVNLSTAYYVTPVVSVSPASLAIDISGGREIDWDTVPGLPVPSTVDGTSAGDPEKVLVFRYKGLASALTATAGMGVIPASANKGETAIKAVTATGPTASVDGSGLPGAEDSDSFEMTGTNPDGSSFSVQFTGVGDDDDPGSTEAISYSVSLAWTPSGSSQTSGGTSVLPAYVAIENGTTEILFAKADAVPEDGTPVVVGSIPANGLGTLSVYAVLSHVHPGEALIGTLAGGRCTIAAGGISALPGIGAHSDYAMSGTCTNGAGQTGQKLSLRLECTGTDLYDLGAGNLGSVPSDGATPSSAFVSFSTGTAAQALSVYAVLGGLAPGTPPGGDAILALTNHCTAAFGSTTLPRDTEAAPAVVSMTGASADGSTFKLQIACTGIQLSDVDPDADPPETPVPVGYDYEARLIWTPNGGTSEVEGGASVLPAYLAVCTGDPEEGVYVASLAWIPPASPAPETTGGETHADIILTSVTASGEEHVSTVNIASLVANLLPESTNP